jgi:hypothetical protein
MNCLKPIEAGVLSDYWLALLTETEEGAIEEHLFRCDECGARMREVIAIAESARRLAQEGNLRMVVSDVFLDRAAEQGLRVREYSPPAGGRVQCTVTAEDDLLIGRLAADLSAAKRVDLSFCDENHNEQLRLRDIPVHAAAGSVAFQHPIAYAKASPSGTLIVRLLAIEQSNERLVGEYTFDHVRTMPGPPGW